MDDRPPVDEILVDAPPEVVGALASGARFLDRQRRGESATPGGLQRAAEGAA